MTTRREFIALTAGAFAVAGLPGAVFAAAPGDRRFVLVLLRGALDGLAAVPPLGWESHSCRPSGESMISLMKQWQGQPGRTLRKKEEIRKS